MSTLKRTALTVILILLSSSPLALGATYHYDDLNRLIVVIYDSGQTIYFEYDAAGNRTRRTIGVDTDRDGLPDSIDNCPTVANWNQQDIDDADGVGDACDLCAATASGQTVDAAGCSNAQVDGDADGFCNPNAPSRGPSNCVTGAAVCAGGNSTDCFDNCPTTANPDQADNDGDAMGNSCDNCVDTPNPDQADTDADKVGNTCDLCAGTASGQAVDTAGCSNAQVDGDADGFCNPNAPSRGPANCMTGSAACSGGNTTDCFDNCPTTANANQIDGDNDGVGNVCDNCVNAANNDQADADQDGQGDACDTCTDTDADGYGNPGFPINVCPDDNCPIIANPDQADGDADRVGDLCDNCPAISNADQADAEGDGLGDACDWCPEMPSLLRLVASDAAPSDAFGYSVAASGDTVVIGAYGDNLSSKTDAGSAYVFVRSGGGWIQQAKLTASDGASDDWFGFSVALAGDTAVIGAYNDDHAAGANAGSAYVFVRSGGTWSQQAKLIASDGSANDVFGTSVALAGDTILVGAQNGDHAGLGDAGSAYVFVRSGSIWTQQAKLTAADSSANDHFGFSVALAGDTAVIGSYLDDNASGVDAGSAYVFVRSGIAWAQQAKLTALESAGGDAFGVSIGVVGDMVVIGAYMDDIGGASNAGSAYVFTRSGGVWTEHDRFIAADRAGEDQFGVSVALAYNAAVIGVHGDDHAGGVNAGSAYLHDWRCYPDDDNDGVRDDTDNCPAAFNPQQEDADSDGVGDVCDSCPNTMAGVPVDAQGCPAPVPGDFDGDFDVDQVDFGHMQACLSLVPQTDPACQDANLDGDSDIDQADVAIFVNCLSGPGAMGDPNCAN